MEIIINNQKNVRDLGIVSGTKLAELDIRNSTLTSVQEINLHPKQTYLYKSKFRSCRFTKADFNDGIIEGCDWKSCDLRSVNFKDTKFTKTIFTDTNLESAIFRNTKLRSIVLKSCDLRSCDFSGADIKSLDIRGCRIEGIKIDPKSYFELTIDRTQAIYFASLSGLVIK